jgi:hypothetical protein
MFLLELFDNRNPDANVDNPEGDMRYEESDQTPLKMSDVRKTRLSLGHINKLRLMHDARKYEREQKLKTLKNQYGSSGEEEPAF